MKILDLFHSDPLTNYLCTPYIIAEAGVNHEGSVETAIRLIDEAKEGGADAIKFQNYRADTLASKFSPAYWDTNKEPIDSQHALFKKHEGFWKDEMLILKEYCSQIEIEFMSTPFDFESAHFLSEMMEVFKISSSDITNKPFIEYICSFGKPVILSTGASQLHEIQEAVSWIDKHRVPAALLHCVLNYPTENRNANLGMIVGLRRAFPDRIIGYSDHTMPEDMKTSEVATLLGSVLLEKHFTHDKTLAGNDHYHAMDMTDLKLFRQRMAMTVELIGSLKVESLDSEDVSRTNARRSIVTTSYIKCGTVIDSTHLTFKRPGHGIAPKHIDEIIGRTTIVDIESDKQLTWSMVGG